LRRFLVPGSLLLILAGPLGAQLRDSLPRITAITLDNRNVFDSTDHSLLARGMNFLHATTRAPFIRREFLFKVGDRYDSARVAETERNLRNLGVFKRVSIDTVRSDSGVSIGVHTQDVLTAQLQESFRNTGGSVVWSVTAIETNLFGTLSAVEAGYQHDPDRSTYVFGFARRRLINDKIGATVQLFDRSDGKLFFAQLSQPWFEAASHTSATLTFDDRRARILQYRFGNSDTAFAITQNRYVLGRFDLSKALQATSRDYVRLGMAVQVRRDDYVGDSSWQATGFPMQSVTGAFGVYAEASHVNKPKVFAFQSLSYDEDVDLSSTIRLSLFAAPSALGYESGHAGIAPGIGVHTGIAFPHGFAFADVSASGLYTRNGLDSGQVSIAGTAVLVPGRRHQLLLHGEANALEQPLPGTEFDLGLGAGPRAFKQHSFTGDREYFATAEYRYTLGRDLLKLADLGVAAFADVGGAWWSGDPRRSGWDAGIGLRAAFGRGAGLGINRIDLAWRGARPDLPGGWVFAVGKGFVFSTSPRGTTR